MLLRECFQEILELQLFFMQRFHTSKDENVN